MIRSRYRGVSISIVIYKPLITIFALLLAFIEATAIDSPHYDLNRIGCDSCHFVRGSEPSLLPPWTSHVPQDIDDTQYNTLCWSCHNDIEAPYVRTHSSLNTDNGYGDWTVECRVCHNPHYQKQFRTYGSASYVYSGASTGLTASTITKTGAGWALNAYKGLVVVPNLLQVNYNYKILSNTSDTLTVQGPLNLSKAAVGNTFAIVYGKLVTDTANLSQIATTPAKSGSKPVRFFNSTGANSFADGNGVYDGICEVCHTQTFYHRNNPSGNHSHNNGVKCTVCHTHSEGFKGTGCDVCHGYPPVNATSGGPAGLADYNGSTGSATAGAHALHVNTIGYSCNECHLNSAGSGATHISGLMITMGFSLAGGTYPGGMYDGQTTANYDSSEPDTVVSKTGTMTCTSIYCHSTGQSITDKDDSTPSYASPVWDDPVSGACGTCHNVSEASGLNSGSHAEHLGGSGVSGCGDCHAGAADDASSYNSSNHVNASINVDNAYTAGGAPGNGYGTCSTASCHDDGTGNLVVTPVWGTDVASCTACHAAVPSTGSHQKHVVTTSYKKADCDSCHDGAEESLMPPEQHLDGNIDVYDSASGDLGYPENKSPGTAYAACSTAYCHSTGQSTASGNSSTPAYSTVTWGGSAGCGTCHGVTEETGLISGSHAAHLGSAGVAGCSDCHTGAANDASSYNSIEHINRFIDVANAYSADGAPGNGYGTCAVASCHEDGTGSMVTTPVWGSVTECSACHAAAPSTGSHTKHLLQSGVACSDCHDAAVQGTTAPTQHLDGNIDVYNSTPGDLGYPQDKAKGSAYSTCSNISCHGGTSATWGGTACLDCHSISQGSRAAITSQFNANSHHIQGAVTNEKCYQCHWEANIDGSINSTHHGGSGASGSAVDLVIYGAGARPSIYTSGTTAVQYMASGTRTEIQRINSHCLGCHSDQNNSTTPFGDGKTPRQYAWDGSSVEARYSQTGTTPWGKYSSATYPNVTPKDKRTKAFSAHGNAVNNEGGWDLNETWPNTRSGAVNVACFDCHNSHGSSVSGTTASYISATTSGGILKDTSAGKGGYNVDYRPAAGGTDENRNIRNAGASLCFDCHLTADGSAAGIPWGYQTTFGSTQAVIGYFDSPYLSPGSSGMQQRYPYKALLQNKGGHFSASSPLSSTPMGTINGLCTPCHDPHGVSPTAVGICSNTAYVTKTTCQSGGGVWTVTPQYGVPMLKGTWMTSPYKEDAAPAYNTFGTVRDSSYPTGHDGTPREGVPYHIDQNTFGANIRATVTGITQTASQFAGLCLNCHPKNSLTDGTNGGTWKSVDRIHESVRGWGGNVRHNYTCAKCHVPHNGSSLPRLMITNCLNSRHKGRVGNNTSAVLSGSGSCDDYNCYGEARTIGFGWWEEAYAFASGGGQFPGSWSGYYPGSYGVTCHENKEADQSWNNVTPWTNSTPSITSGPSSTGQLVLMHMDEASWNGTPGEVSDSSGRNNNGTAYSGANTVTGGSSGRAGSFNGTSNSVVINYSPPVDSFTIEAWIKPTATHQVDSESVTGTGGTSGQRYLFWPDHKGAEGGAGISAGTNGISVYEHGSGYMPAMAVYNGAISTSQWTHIAVVYSDKKPSIYVNGVLVRTGLKSAKTHVYAPTVIGGGSYGYFPGTVDEVSIYQGALSADEIILHYQQNSAVVCNSTEKNIVWTTDFDSTSYVDFGLTAGYGSTAGNSSSVKNHSIVLSGLSAPATYHYRVRSSNSNGETVSSDYTFDTYTCPPATPTLTSPTATSVSTTTVTLGANVTASGGPAITARGTVWGISANPTGNAAAEGGTSTGVYTHSRTGLPSGTRIYYRGYATNSAGTRYSPDGSFYTEPLTQAAGVNFTSVWSSGMTVKWTRGTGDGVLVLMRQGSAVVTDPTDGIYTAYSGNASLGSGTDIGGAYVIYKGTGTSVTVNGLAAGTTYNVAVYEYKGTLNTAAYAQGTNYRSPPATGSQATSTGSSGGTVVFPISHMVNCYSGTFAADAGNIIWAGPYLDEYDECDVDRTFLMFDTSSLGAGATITSARLYLDFQTRDYLSQNAVTNIHESSWVYPPNSGTCSNVGTYLANNTVLVNQAFGLTTFNINPASINKTGNTGFAVKGADETICDNADPGYNRATSYLEVDYTSN
ncbi:MAG: CxxxxCH/CxxCH domain-containing protein [Nitrospiraceae bacterium]|nr:MAG: CxxxxCH/CxxCH domain-containing protein [Nitrospiraceae bacterium]